MCTDTSTQSPAVSRVEVFNFFMQRATYNFLKILRAAFLVKTCILYENLVLLLQFL